MVKLVFARHGESEWNKANLFTGWADVDLSEKGTQQAIDAGKLIKEAGIEFDQAYTSVLKRAIKTTNLALEASDQLWVPVEKCFHKMTGILITLEQNLNWMKLFQNLKQKSEQMQTEKLSKTEMVAKDVLIPIKSLVGNTM